MIKIISLILVSSFLIACNDGGKAVTENNQNEQAKPIIPNYTKNNLYFYTKSARALNSPTILQYLMAYDESANTVINVATTGSTFNYSYYGGDFNPSNLSISNYKFKGVYYAENGMLYSAGEDAKGMLITRQISSLSTVTSTCSSKYSSFNFIFTGPGGDNSCGTIDDTGTYYVTPDMDESTPAVKFNGDLLASVHSYTTTSIVLVSQLVFFNNELRLYAKDFSSSTIIDTGFSSVDDISQNKNYVILNIDGVLRSYNTKTTKLSGALHTLITAAGLHNPLSTTSTIYFIDDNKIFGLDFNGNTNSKLIVSNSLNLLDINIITIVDDLILYSNRDTLFNLKTVNLTSGKINNLMSTAKRLDFFGYNASLIYYNQLGAGFNNNTAVAMNIDGTGKVEEKDSLWVGTFESSTITSKYNIGLISSIIINELTFDQNNMITGGTLVSYDASNNKRKFVLGTLPNDVVSASITGTGTTGLGEFKRTDSSSDIFYLDIDQEQSLIRVTNTKESEWTL